MKRLVLSALALTLLVGCESVEVDPFDDERPVPIGDLPPAVMTAAMNAVPGLFIDDAEVETEDGRPVYELDGHVDGREVEIELTAEGEILDIEYADEDD